MNDLEKEFYLEHSSNSFEYVKQLKRSQFQKKITNIRVYDFINFFNEHHTENEIIFMKNDLYNFINLNKIIINAASLIIAFLSLSITFLTSMLVSAGQISKNIVMLVDGMTMLFIGSSVGFLSVIGFIVNRLIIINNGQLYLTCLEMIINKDFILKDKNK